ncbi:MAG: DUF2461 family protein [Christensenellales bacterium]|jgi:uncharacterized protein (TIGR02453 family)
MADFQGFTPAAPQFLLDLHFHNDRQWFDENREVFDRELRQPCLALAEALLPAAREANPNFDPRPEKAVSRIYRDARYARGVPFKDYIMVNYRPAGKRTGESLTVYFYLSFRDWSVGLGSYSELREMMDGFRNRLATRPASFLSLLSRPEMAAFRTEGERFRRLSVPGDLPETLLPWYTLRSFYYERSFPSDDPRLFDRDKLLSLLRESVSLLAPVYRYIAGL